LTEKLPNENGGTLCPLSNYFLKTEEEFILQKKTNKKKQKKQQKKQKNKKKNKDAH
jgi:hypothetical protein